MFSLPKKKKKNKLPARLRGNSCLNCNELLEGEENFCPNCGQRNNINQLSFKLFVDEFFGDLFSYDSRLWGTVFPLILKPGKVAYEFVNGKRKEYVNPFRTYLTVSLIFFLTYGLMNTIGQYQGGETNNGIFNFTSDAKGGFKDGIKEGWNKGKAEKDSIVKATLNDVQKDLPINLDSTLAANNINLDSIDTQSAIDSIKNNATKESELSKKIKAFYNYSEEHSGHTTIQALDSLGYKNTFWNRFYYDKSQSVKKMKEDDGESFSEKIFSGLSLGIFLLLPFFAIFLKIIYIRRKYTYMEHMVFVFYTQAVFFLLMLLFLIIDYFSNGNDSLIAITLGLFVIYLFIAMKKFYKQSWFKTFFKFLLANFSFMIMSIFGLSILALVSFIIY